MKYYVKNGGNDGADGKTPDTAWASIEKVNLFTFRNGDIVVFNRGDKWYGKLTIGGTRTANNRPVTVGAYGVGPLPYISAYKIPNADAWVEHAPGVWKINLGDASKFTGNVGLLDAQGANVGFLKVDGKIYGVKRWSLANLSAPPPDAGVAQVAATWDFYSDMTAKYLYVLSPSNPGARSISVAVGQRCVGEMFGVRIANIHFQGCGGHALGDAFRDFSIRGCWISEIGGGELLGAPAWPTRYGNGAQMGNTSARCSIEGNFFWDIYDVACTMQGDSVSTTGWTDISFRHNVILRCNQSFETYALGAGLWPAGTGFKRCEFVENICIDTGYGWSAEVRPDRLTRSPILFYSMDAPVNDIRINRNKFYGCKDALIASGSGKNFPTGGYNVDDNQFFVRKGVKVFSKDATLVENFSTFVSAYNTGHRCTVEFLDESDDPSLATSMAKTLNVVSANSATSNILANVVSDLYGMVAMALGDIDSATQPMLVGSANPTSLPPAQGVFYLNTTSLQLFYSIGTAASDWRATTSIVSSGSAPGFIPQFLGRIYVDTSTRIAYLATGNEEIADWVMLNPHKRVAPSLSSSFGVAGQYSFNTTHFFICVATSTGSTPNAWKRIALSDW